MPYLLLWKAMERSLTVFLLLSVFVAGVELASIPLKLESGVQDVANAAPVVWKDCSHDHKFMKVDNVVLNPNPPRLGATVDIQATIETYKNITNKDSPEVKLSVTEEGSPIHFEKTYDLCQMLQKLKLSCPLPARKFDLHLSHSIPGFIPKAKYSGKAVLLIDNQEAACFTVDLDLTG